MISRCCTASCSLTLNRKRSFNETTQEVYFYFISELHLYTQRATITFPRSSIVCHPTAQKMDLLNSGIGCPQQKLLGPNAGLNNPKVNLLILCLGNISPLSVGEHSQLSPPFQQGRTSYLRHCCCQKQLHNAHNDDS